MQSTVKEITRQLHQAETALEGATEIVLLGDNTWRPATGGRMPAGAAKVAVLGPLPKTATATATIGATTGRRRTAAAANGRAARRTTTARPRAAAARSRRG